jgi:MFS family permease
MNNVQLGLKPNWKQFWLLVLINALVGGMIGLERTILPQIAKDDFGIEGNTTILSFIIVFGLAKSITNYLTGVLADRFGRKNILIAGWLIGLPVPFILMGADSWAWIVFANVLLGINQGFTWSSTVVMKIDLVGDKQRGFAMGLNEFAGYVAVALAALATSYIADRYGVRPYPFYLGIGFSVLGVLLSILFVRDTSQHVKAETVSTNQPLLKHPTIETTWSHNNLGSVTQAGFANNLNDAMVWGILPIVLLEQGYNLKQVGVITALYPAVWGLSQLFTGRLSDRICKKHLLFWGMLMQGVAILLFLVANSVITYASIAIVLGIGTAVVYPTFLAAVAENVHPTQRAEALGTFRFWRDFGYVAGAAATGILSDISGKETAIAFVGLLTIGSALIIVVRMYCMENKPEILNKMKPETVVE